MSETVELRITDRRSFADGQAFETGGPYERIVGRALFSVDPRGPENAFVVDLDHAPVDPAGRVSFAADFMLLKPCEMAQSNRRLFFDYGNRGHKRALQFFNDAPASNDPLTLADAGNGFLMAGATWWPGSPGKVISCRAMGGWCSICRWRPMAGSRSPGWCGSSMSSTSLA